MVKERQLMKKAISVFLATAIFCASCTDVDPGRGTEGDVELAAGGLGASCADGEPGSQTSMGGAFAGLTPKYGSNGKFLEPVGKPAEGSTPIATRAELEAVRGNLGGKYCLACDIDLGGAEWVPIGDGSSNAAESRFTGTFDGQGHVIRNLTVTGEGHGHDGLFGAVHGANVKNVGFEGTSLSISPSAYYNYAAAVCGGAYAASVIRNCYNEGGVSVYSYSKEEHASTRAGGVCGDLGGSSLIVGCYNAGDVSAGAASSYAGAGGVCGYASKSALIGSCFNTGKVSAPFNANAGGIAGATSHSSHISNCSNFGEVCAADSVGGISGFVASGSSISSCWNAGEVCASASEGYAKAGGIVGCSASAVSDCFNTGSVSARSSSERSACAGGISGDGRFFESPISNCYNAGAVSSVSDAGPSYIGGISGRYYDFSYVHGDGHGFDTAASNYCLDLYGSGYGVQLAPAQMLDAASFNGFDFIKVWGMSPSLNGGRPFLRKVALPCGAAADPFKIDPLQRSGS